jgi:hypothetical protein
MSNNVISFDDERASRYIIRVFAGFLADPADSDHQRGFLDAMLTLYEEGLGRGVNDDRLKLLKAQVGR